jgi:hypothetical protein
MTRNALKPQVSLLLLVASTVTFATGLVLLTTFHMGLGTFRADALGLSRLAWLNVHRLSAVVTMAAQAVHLALNGRALVGRVRSAFGPRQAHGTTAELLLYAAFATMAVTGFAAWLAEGSAPLQGPIPLGFTPHPRHLLVDLHHASGLLALALTVHHLGHRWRQLVRGLDRRGVPAGAGR